VKAAAGVSYGHVVEALDVARGCGANRIGLIGGPPAGLRD
jgi:biopolymer transport protein ExbD